MKYGALFGWGIVIYAIMFLSWSAFVLYGFSEGMLPRLAGLLVLIVMATIAGYSLRKYNWRDILPYSIFWLAEVILLDIVMSVPYTGWALFSDANIWVGYALVVLVPLFVPFVHIQSHDHPENA